MSSFKYTAPSENPQDAAQGVPSVGAQVPHAAAAGGGRSTDGPRGAPQQPDPTATMAPIVRSAEEKIGRNDPCHCGSGKKYKHCHGR